jgi:hypothetical protein
MIELFITTAVRSSNPTQNCSSLLSLLSMSEDRSAAELIKRRIRYKDDYERCTKKDLKGIVRDLVVSTNAAFSYKVRESTMPLRKVGSLAGIRTEYLLGISVRPGPFRDRATYTRVSLYVRVL